MECSGPTRLMTKCKGDKKIHKMMQIIFFKMTIFVRRPFATADVYITKLLKIK